MAVTLKYAYKTGQSMLGGYNSNEESNLVMTGYKKAEISTLTEVKTLP